jgi:hypothetical protein
LVSNWMLQRFRAAWLSANLPLLVLRLLRVSTSSDWEILSFLHEKFGLTPTAKEFERLERSLIGKGYAILDPHPGSRMQITAEGLRLLGRLEEDHSGLVASVPGKAGGSGAVSPQERP